MDVREKMKTLLLSNEESVDTCSTCPVKAAFVKFFEDRGHVYVPSSSVVPKNDTTLLFTNSGMNQFKPIFLGSKMPDHNRVVNFQKCIRAGGKHNDLDDVGKDVYHHTFFEMLGSWSFGDYYKEDAIRMAYEFLTQTMGLEKDRLYFTYFSDKESGLPEDTDTRDIWISQGVDAKRVLPFKMKENFWEMGETGPCGPCTEIHYDRIGGRDASLLVNKDDPDVIEIWNLVFIQYNRTTLGLEPLEKCHVDTGMGYERLVSVVMDVRSNYDTTIFKPLLDLIHRHSGVRPYEGKIGKEDAERIDTAYRVLADHARTLAIALSDECAPSNEGRGYVVRRIIRRAIRYATEVLRADDLLISEAVALVMKTFEKDYGTRYTKEIENTIQSEQSLFKKTLSRGLLYVKRLISELDGSVIPGKSAWMLYDTYGFPIDLTLQIAEENGLTIDLKEFEKEKEKSIQLSKNVLEEEEQYLSRITLLSSNGVKPTDDSSKYDSPEIEAVPVCLFAGDFFYIGDELAEKISSVEGKCYIVMNKTCFYSESGGQVGDRGTIEFGSVVFDVIDTQKREGYVFHSCIKVRETEFRTIAVAKINEKLRLKAARNHTATHLVNFEMRRLLGSDLEQHGSYVSEHELRFDYNSKRLLVQEEVTALREAVQKKIHDNLRMYCEEMSIEEAQSIRGIRAKFGKKYGKTVRVASIGVRPRELLAENGPDGYGYSVELCGGTHLSELSDLVSFEIVSVSSRSSDVKRLLCITGEEAVECVSRGLRTLDELKTCRTEEELRSTLSVVSRSTYTYEHQKQINEIIVIRKREFLKENKNRVKTVAEETKNTLQSGRTVLNVETDYDTFMKVVRTIKDTISYLFLYCIVDGVVHFYSKPNDVEAVRKIVEDYMDQPFFSVKDTEVVGRGKIKERVNVEDMQRDLSFFFVKI